MSTYGGNYLVCWKGGTVNETINLMKIYGNERSSLLINSTLCPVMWNLTTSKYLFLKQVSDIVRSWGPLVLLDMAINQSNLFYCIHFVASYGMDANLEQSRDFLLKKRFIVYIIFFFALRIHNIYSLNMYNWDEILNHASIIIFVKTGWKMILWSHVWSPG